MIRLYGDAGGRSGTDADLLDEYALAVGIRTVAVDGTRFLINGEPFNFTGFGMHEDHVTVGKGHNDALMLRDFELLEWIGANSFRTSHYPYAESFMDYADRHGIVVIDETPAVGLNMGLGGGIFGTQGYTTFSPETVNEATQEVHAQVIRELIARDKNHPSVVLWSIANEPESDTAEAEDYFRPLFDVARQADPTRPVGFVNVMTRPYPTCRVAQFADVIMLNRYYGWYVHTGDLIAAEKGFEEELRGWASEGKPIIITEYGADTMPGLHQLPARSVERGVPGRLPGDEPPGLRPGARPWSASRCGTSPTSRPRRASCGSAATRRASSPGIGSPRWPPTTCVSVGRDAPSATSERDRQDAATRCRHLASRE